MEVSRAKHIDFEKVARVRSFMDKYGFTLVSYGPGASFFRKQDATLEVIHMNHKQFATFMEVLQQLDHTKTKLDNYIKFVSNT